jgi:hypothetical protein
MLSKVFHEMRCFESAALGAHPQFRRGAPPFSKIMQRSIPDLSWAIPL